MYIQPREHSRHETAQVGSECVTHKLPVEFVPLLQTEQAIQQRYAYPGSHVSSHVGESFAVLSETIYSMYIA